MSFERLRNGLAGAALVLGLAICGPDSDLDSSFQVQVFADWNGDGVPSSDEGGVQAVEIRVEGGASATTAQGGEARFEVEEGAYQVSLGQIPPHFRLTTPAQATVQATPDGTGVAKFGIRPDVPADRIPYKFVLVGDSITAGFSKKPGSDEYEVYPFDGPLKIRLDRHFGRSAFANRAAPGTKSSCGVSMLPYRLSGAVGLLTCDCKRSDQPLGSPEEEFYRDREPFGSGAYFLFLYGANDINDGHHCTHPSQCGNFPGDCQTLQNLDLMVRRTQAAGGIPILGTLLPINKAYDDGLNRKQNQVVESYNAQIRDLAARDGVLLNDYWKAFKSPKSPSIDQLISDGEIRNRGLHPTRAGYDLMAEVAYYTITGQPSPYRDTQLPAPMPLDQALDELRQYLDAHPDAAAASSLEDIPLIRPGMF